MYRAGTRPSVIRGPGVGGAGWGGRNGIWQGGEYGSRDTGDCQEEGLLATAYEQMGAREKREMKGQQGESGGLEVRDWKRGLGARLREQEEQVRDRLRWQRQQQHRRRQQLEEEAVSTGQQGQREPGGHRLYGTLPRLATGALRPTWAELPRHGSSGT